MDHHEEVDKLREEVAKLKQINDDLEVKNTEGNARIIELNSEISRYEIEVGEFRARLAQKEGKLPPIRESTVAGELEELDEREYANNCYLVECEKNNLLERKLDRMEVVVGELRRKLQTRVIEENEGYMLDVLAAKKQVRKLNKQVEELKEALAEKKEDLVEEVDCSTYWKGKFGESDKTAKQLNKQIWILSMKRRQEEVLGELRGTRYDQFVAPGNVMEQKPTPELRLPPIDKSPSVSRIPVRSSTNMQSPKQSKKLLLKVEDDDEQKLFLPAINKSPSMSRIPVRSSINMPSPKQSKKLLLKLEDNDEQKLILPRINNSPSVSRIPVRPSTNMPSPKQSKQSIKFFINLDDNDEQKFFLPPIPTSKTNSTKPSRGSANKSKIPVRVNVQPTPPTVVKPDHLSTNGYRRKMYRAKMSRDVTSPKRRI